MSEIITMTEALSVADAERLSSRIGLKLDSMADTWVGALPLIREAIARNAFAVLGYASHGAYVADRFGDSLAKLGVDMRREVVRELSDAGLSTRAIAPVVGVSQKTVVKDMQLIPQVSPEVVPAVVALPVPVTGLDGKIYKTRKPKAEPAFVPSVTVPEGDDPFEYESECHVDPSGGVNDLKQLLKRWDGFLTNYQTFPSKSQLVTLETWLGKQTRKTDAALDSLRAGDEGRQAWILEGFNETLGILRPMFRRVKRGKTRNVLVNNLHVAIDELEAEPNEDAAANVERAGASDWSRQIQNISASIPIEMFTQDELLELRGAVEFLHNYIKGEQITRGTKAAE